MDMPESVKAFFEAGSRNDADNVSLAFSNNAIVEDEGANHQGRDAIRTWWMAAKEATQFVAEPIETTEKAEQVLVRAKVSGVFPGSPVMLTYFFTIEDGKIIRLEIRP